MGMNELHTVPILTAPHLSNSSWTEKGLHFLNDRGKYANHKEENKHVTIIIFRCQWNEKSSNENGRGFHNIANVNTVGFKSSRVLFQDMMSQTMSNATAPGNGLGGINATQIGLGFRRAPSILSIQSVPRNRSQHGFLYQRTRLLYGTRTRSKWRNHYTRDGAFVRDSNGTLTNSDGMQVLGRSVNGGQPVVYDDNFDENTALSGQDAVSPLSIPSTLTVNGKP